MLTQQGSRQLWSQHDSQATRSYGDPARQEANHTSASGTDATGALAARASCLAVRRLWELAGAPVALSVRRFREPPTRTRYLSAFSCSCSVFGKLQMAFSPRICRAASSYAAAACIATSEVSGMRAQTGYATRVASYRQHLSKRSGRSRCWDA